MPVQIRSFVTNSFCDLYGTSLMARIREQLEAMGSYVTQRPGVRRYYKTALSRAKRRQAKRDPEGAIRKRAWYHGYQY